MLQEGGFAVEERYSVWQKKKVKTFIVNAHSKSPITKSIATALQHAKPYDRIELTSGEYAEAITLNFPVELVASDGEEAVIVSRSSAVTITGNVEVYLERLTLTSKGNSKLEAGLTVMGGTPVVFNCQISSVLLGGASQTHIEHCTITDSANGFGLLVHDQASGRVTGTTIHSHSHACVDVDTRGEFTITECNLYNYEGVGGDVVVVSGTGGAGGRADGLGAEPPATHVTVSNCQLYVSKEEVSGRRATAKEGLANVNNVAGVPCCVVISNGAAPTFASNELIEGAVGFLLDGPGAAQLRGNIIRNQYHCGVIALVEEGYSMLRGRNSLRIAGDNVIDHCYIGVDVQSNTSRAFVGTTASGADKKLSNDLPLARRASHWLGDDLGATMKGSAFPRAATVDPRDDAADDCLQQPVLVDDDHVPIKTLLERIRYLARSSLQAYPTCTQGTFNIVSVMPPLVPVQDGTRSAASSLPTTAPSSGLADIARHLLQVTTSPAERDSSRLAMMELFGNQGVDILNTKFSSCVMCAIRFGRQGYGVVEDCVFEDCGTHGIIVDSAAHPVITGCRFARSRGAGILVGNFGNPLIIGNEITGGQVEGIELTSLSRGLIVGNLISANHGVGIKVDGSSYPIIAGNAVSQNRGGGLVVLAGSRPTVLHNTFFGNLTSHICCDNYADALIAYNHLQSTNDIGIHLTGCSRSTVLKNDISANGEGVLVELDADPIVRHNHIQSNLRSGILCQNNAMGTFTQNTVSDNSGANVLLKEGASGVFRDNLIERGAQGGVVVILEGGGWFERNRISGNSVANVLVADAFTDPSFSHNAIFGSLSGCGVICAAKSKPVFACNEIYENSQAGVYVTDGGQGLFTANVISREAVGVLVAEGGLGQFRDNRVEGCYGTGVLTQSGGDPLFESNKISGSQLSGIQISPDGVGTFTGNEIYGNDVGIQAGSALAAARLQVSSVYLSSTAQANTPSAVTGSARASGTGASAYAHPFTNRKSVLLDFATSAEDRKANAARSSACKVVKNVIRDNANGGILLEAEPHGEFEENLIHDNGDYGIRGDVEYARNRAERIMRSHFAVSTAGPSTEPASAPRGETRSITLRRNDVFRHAEANVFMAKMSQYAVYLDENNLSVAPMGIYITHGSNVPRAHKNEIHHCLEGVYMDDNGTGSFTGNHIHHCQYTGIYVTGMADPQWTEGNRVEYCGLSGVMVDVSGRGAFTDMDVTHCCIGVVCFVGPATPFHMSYETLGSSGLLSAFPVFEKNRIVEHDLHGILILSVIAGCPLRVPLDQQREQEKAGDEYFTPLEAVGAHVGPLMVAQKKSLCPLFKGNHIARNRMFGVYHDRFEFWDFAALSTSRAARGSISPRHGVKNAFGGYEILLGTSQVHHFEEHHNQRQQKQISFVENVICDCSFGFGAGYGCHPFLLRNRIVKNYFFGLFLRFGSAVMADGCEIGENGLAGLYAANGAKGFIASGRLYANNGLCRPLNSGNAVRDFNEAVFSQTFVPAAERAAMHMSSGSRAPEVPSPAMRRSSSGVEKAYAQLTSLGDVHNYVMADTARLLGELVMASSDGMSLASGCAPSPLSAGVARRFSGGTTALGGVEIDEYIRVCTADGGIGAWIENGSRTTMKANTIEDHTHIGVFVSKGVLHHHRILAKHFAVDMARLQTDKQDVFAGQLEPPPLASAHQGTLFTSHTVCAAGVEAANQLLHSDRAQLSLEESLLSGNVSMVMNPAELLAAARDDDAKEQRADSIHFAHVVENTIRRNAYGVFVELYHVLRAAGVNGAAVPGGAPATRPPLTPSALRTSMTAAAGRVASAPSSTQVEAAEGSSGSGPLTAQDLAVMEGDAGRLDHVVVVEGNRVTENTKTGILCEHIVDVVCGELVASRGALNDRIADHYEAVRSRLLLSGPTSAAVEAKPCLFSLFAVPQKTQHAHIAKNTVSKNTLYQGELLSRYVAVTQDKTRTLLQFDTMTVPQASPYCSQVLFGVPLFASLTQLPPPGVFLWEGNTISDSRNGVRVVGYFGSKSVRFVGNMFVGMQEDALHVEGHLACVTVGCGNTFEQNGTAVHITTAGPDAAYPRSAADSATLSLQRDQRTRIYQNFFKGAKEQALRLEATGGGAAPLVYRNEFSEFAVGTTAAFVTDTSTCLLLNNVFRDSFCPVIVRGGAGDAGSLSTTTRAPLVLPSVSAVDDDGDENADGTHILLCENKFIHNFIGVLVCHGAAPRLLRNLFEANARSGLEIVGSYTRPAVVECVFLNHIHSDEDTGGAVATSTAMSVAQRSRASLFANNGKVWLTGSTFSITLVAENQHILSPNSTVRLPAGLLLAPMAEASIRQCLFHNNDVGVDAVRDALSSLVASSTQAARFETCLFERHRVAGVLVRGSTADSSAGGETKSTAATASLQARRVSVPGTSGAELPPETTTFHQCYFVRNTNDASYGDVIAVARGFVVFRKCVFYGTVHAKADGMAIFVENFFPSRSSSDDADEGRLLTSPVAAHTTPAFVLHERAMVRLESNHIFQRAVGGEARPAADGRVHGNLFVGCTVGLSVGPFCRTVFTNNRILSSKDCGLIAYGGIINDNEIFDAPTGAVVQDPSVYKGINAIPTTIRTSGFDLSLTGNTLLFCGGDGCLVAGPGTFDGNYISNCRNGFNVVCPPANDGKMPLLKRNFVFDNKVGVVLNDNSASTVQDNDIFDNDVAGVLVEGSAGGLLQSNRISSANEHGAVEQPSETRVKSLGNTIRNQFSPAFNRGVRSSRLKQSEERERKLEAEVVGQEDVVQSLFANEGRLSTVCQCQMKELLALLTEPVAAVPNAYAGAPSRAMRRSSVPRPTVELTDVAQTPHKETRSSGGARGSNRATSFRRQRGASVSKASVVAQKRVMSASKGGKKVSQNVLIHVFVSGGTSGADVQSKGLTVGHSVATVLAAPPMNKMNLATDVTCTTAQLAAYLETTTPSLVVVVVDRNHGDLNSIEERSLYALDTTVTASPHACVMCLLVPTTHTTVCDSTPSSTSHRGGGPTGTMSLASFAAKHSTIEYDQSVDEALETLKSQITSVMRSRRRSSTTAAGDSANSQAMKGEEDGDEVDDDGAQATEEDQTASHMTPHAPSKPSPPTTFSREKVSQLMSLLTPEALGYGVPSPTTAVKKRKSVVSMGTSTTADDGKSKSSTKRAASTTAANSRRGSVSGKATRTTSFKGKTGSRRASVAAGTSSPTKKRRGSVRQAPSTRDT